MARDDIDHLEIIARFLGLSLTPIIFVFGIVGNSLSIIVLKTDITSTTVYLIFLSIADASMLVAMAPRSWLLYYDGTDVWSINEILCKVNRFLLYTLSSWSNIILVAVSIERMIATLRPFKVNRVCTPKRSVFICISSLLFVCLFNSHVIYGMKMFEVAINGTLSTGSSINATNNTFGSSAPIGAFVMTSRENGTGEDTATKGQDSDRTANDAHIQVSPPMTTICKLRDESYAAFFDNVFAMLDLVIFVLLVNGACAVASLVIIRQLTSVSRGAEDGSRPVQGIANVVANTRRERHIRRTNQITKTLLLVNVVFLVSNTPFVVYLIGLDSWVDSVQGMTPVQYLIWAIAEMLYLINRAVNFILYVMSGERFRLQFIALVSCQNTSLLSKFSTKSFPSSITFSKGPRSITSGKHYKNGNPSI